MAIPLAGSAAIVAHPLINGWIGPTFAATAKILQMLAVLVVIRVGTATSGVILQGAGGHERLTVYIGATGVANLALSVVLVRHLGLPGVALGTIIPVTLMSACAIFPSACRRVGLPIVAALREAVWPAVWPISGSAAWLAAVAPAGQRSGPELLAHVVVAVAIYAALVWLAIGRDARADYSLRLRRLLPRGRSPVATAAASLGARSEGRP
jgi:hypothetical protein